MEYFLKATIITTLFYTCYILFLQRETFFESNRWFLLFGLLTTVVLPLIIIPIYIENPNTVVDLMVYNTNINATTTSNTDTSYLIFVYIYLFGVSIFLLKLVFEIYSLLQILLKNKSFKKNGLIYVETKDEVSPFSFFNYIVYNPKVFNAKELQHIINHEKVHVKQKHSIDTLLVQLATAIFWFNPFIWLYKKELQQNLEFIADKKALYISTCKKSYEYTLLKSSISKQQFILTNNFYSSLIKKRIVMLNKSKSNNLNLLKYAFILPLLGMFLMSFNTKEVYLNESSFNNIQTIGNAEIVIINKDFTDAALEKIKKTFKKNNVELHFKGIKRNDLNEIIALKIEGVSKKSKTNFNSNSSKAIKPIKITYNSDNESISIGSIDDNTIFITEDNTTKIVKSGAGSTVFITSEDNTNTSNNATVIIEEENNKETKVAINKLEEEANDTNIFKAEANKNKLKINTEVDSGIVVYIDGKKSTKDAMEALDPNHIASMHVYKGDKMTKEFGPLAKEGIIMITTK